MSRAKRRDEGCCSVDFLKNVLHIYNILFLISGLLVLGTAIWTMLDKYKYVVLLSTDIYPTMIYCLLTAGGLVVIVTIVGVCAVTKEHRPLLLVYIFSLLLIFLLEAMVGILAFVYQDLVHNELEMMKLNVTIAEVYGVDDTKTRAIDFLQDEFDCCGADDFEDWTLSEWREISNGNLVPDSCCKTYTPRCGRRTHPSNIHYMGCLDRMEDHLKGHLTILSSVGLGICVLQIFGIIYACMLYCKLLNVEDIHI